MSVPELEQAIAKLPKDELSQFAKWFEEFMADEWDRQIERDVAAGKFDAIIQKVDADIDVGRSKPL
jgi:hypothetical protein